MGYGEAGEERRETPETWTFSLTKGSEALTEGPEPR